MKLSLLTLNLHGHQEADPIENFREIARYIHEQEIDLIAFQEASQLRQAEEVTGEIFEDNPLTVICDYLRERGKEYESVWAFSHFSYQQMYQEGVAILSRFPITAREERYISRSCDPTFTRSRKIARARVDIHGISVDLYSCHLGWYDCPNEPFSFQWRQLDSWVKEQPDRALLLGDFNNDAGTPGYRELVESGYQDCYPLGSNQPGFTVDKAIDGWKDNQKSLRIDYIFANWPVRVESSEVVFSDPMLSDHKGVRVDIRI
ncbi:endonuclease/exonuclease/phosphatase family protein [Dongshaea marina]|uniref:endonuclease/exonuclease/phosphatase family protein n=1 Tax=Dongshaea marina TaxID=2047966 RepID=UPI000D3E2D78|nr:endonuclease/exonuclease/phosphatase family protein [Dongshaea marina]